MKIKIVQNPIVCGGSLEIDKYRKMLQAVAGQWLEVETQYLFQNQFNTVPIPSISKSGLRVMAGHVQDIKDDIRPNRLFDMWTHKNYKNKNSLPKKVRSRKNFKKNIYRMVIVNDKYKIALKMVPAYKNL